MQGVNLSACGKGQGHKSSDDGQVCVLRVLLYPPFSLDYRLCGARDHHDLQGWIHGGVSIPLSKYNILNVCLTAD